jgi:gamma-glutamyltranspeptidase/glutathione hydrolase
VHHSGFDVFSNYFRNSDEGSQSSARYENSDVNYNESSRKLWRYRGSQNAKLTIATIFAVAVSSCETSIIDVVPGGIEQGAGMAYVAGDEPQAVLAAREILVAGGSAADAAVALSFALSATLQSSAGLGGGGTCVVYDAQSGQVDALDFLPVPATGKSKMARWQVAIPALPRGMYALHAKYGRLPWSAAVSPAENIIRFRHSVGRALALDLGSHSDALVNDPAALDIFMSPERRVLREGERIHQLDLAATIGQLRGRTPAAFYTGVMAVRLDERAEISGLSLSAADLRKFAPVWRTPRTFEIDRTRIFLTGSADAESAFEAQLQEPAAPANVNLRASPPGATGFVIKDRRGSAVACSLTMLTPFGSGVIPSGTGFLSAPSPEFLSEPISHPIVALAFSTSRSAIEFVAASGGVGAGEVMGMALGDQLTDGGGRSERPVGQRPFVNLIKCFPTRSRQNSCIVENDPSGFGFAIVVAGS